MNARMFFSSVRWLLALDAARVALGEVAKLVIREDFIPKLEGKLSDISEDDSQKRAKVQVVLDLWRIYSDDRRSESAIWNKEAIGTIMGMGKARNLSEDKLEDIVSAIMGSFLIPKRGTPSYKNLGKFDAMKGPMEFVGWWKGAIGKWTLAEMRREVLRLNVQTEHEDNIPRPQTPGGLTAAKLKEVMRELERYIRSKTDEVGERMFDIWLDQMTRGSGSFGLSSGIYEPLEEETGLSRHTLRTKWKAIADHVVKFFQDELDEPIYISDRVRKRLKLTAADVVTETAFRRQLRAWVLEPSQRIQRMLDAQL